MSRLMAFIVGKTVVPHEGTWIEIMYGGRRKCNVAVVPHEGTWIEIQNLTRTEIEKMSFPTRERGLKF